MIVKHGEKNISFIFSFSGIAWEIVVVASTVGEIVAVTSAVDEIVGVAEILVCCLGAQADKKKQSANTDFT